MGGFRKFGTMAAAWSLGLLLSGVSATALAAPTVQIAQSAEQTAQNYFYAGFEALQQNRLDEATSMFEGGLEYSPNNAIATYYLAVAYDRMGDFERAEPLYERAAALAPGTEEGRAAQERLQLARAALGGSEPVPPRPRSIREVFENSAAAQGAIAAAEPRQRQALPPPPIGRAATPAPSLTARTGPVAAPPYVPPAPAAPVAAPARPAPPVPVQAEAAPAEEAERTAGVPLDAASRFSVFGQDSGPGRVPVRMSVDRSAAAAETAPTAEAPPAASAPAAEPPQIAWDPPPAPALPEPASDAEAAAARPSFAESLPPMAEAPAPVSAPSETATPADMSAITAAPAAPPAARPTVPIEALTAELPRGGTTEDLNARALRFVAAREGGAVSVRSSAAAPAPREPARTSTGTSSGAASMRSSGETPAASLNQRVMEQLGASGSSASDPAPAADAGATADGVQQETDAGAQAAQRSATSNRVIDLRDRAAPPASRPATRPSAQPAPEAQPQSVAEMPRDERPSLANESDSAEPAPAPSTASGGDLPKGSTTATLNALALARLAQPSPATQTPVGMSEPAEQRPESPAAAAQPVVSETAPAENAASEPDATAPAAVAERAVPAAQPSAVASVGSDTAARSLNERSLAALVPSEREVPEQTSAPATAQASAAPDMRAELSERGGAIAALPLPKDPQSLTLPDGTVYYGDLQDGLPHGTGRLVFKDGSIYVGSFRDGKRAGHGVLEMSGGWRFEGEFQNNQYDGLGEMSWPDGATYVGEFRQGERTGRGVYWWPNGAKYEGNFVAGEPNGIGTYFYPDGRAETGTWEKGKLVSAS